MRVRLGHSKTSVQTMLCFMETGHHEIKISLLFVESGKSLMWKEHLKYLNYRRLVTKVLWVIRKWKFFALLHLVDFDEVKCYFSHILNLYKQVLFNI